MSLQLHRRLPAPNGQQLHGAIGRVAAAGMCYGLAALVLHRSGYPNQGTYAVMAVAMLPQLLMLARARRDPGRRSSLRVSRRPMLLHAAIAVVLGAMSIVVLVDHGIAFGPGWAAAVATLAATLAACPPVIWFPARAGVMGGRGSGRAGRRTSRHPPGSN